MRLPAFLVALLLLVTACGRVDYPPHPAADELRAAFVEAARDHGVRLREEDVPLILVGSIDGESTMAVCLHGSGQIVISDTWRNDDAEYLEAVAMHEYGHCILDLRHTSDRTMDIMAPGGVGFDDYWANRDALLDKLFGGSR